MENIPNLFNETALFYSDQLLFDNALKRIGVIDKGQSSEQYPILGFGSGLKCQISSIVPKEKAWLVSGDGKLLKVFNLLEDKNKIKTHHYYCNNCEAKWKEENDYCDNCESSKDVVIDEPIIRVPKKKA